MRQRVVRVGYAALGVDFGAEIAREHHRCDARDVGLEREHLQVEQQLDVLVER